jgi:hypothetical protein
MPLGTPIVPKLARITEYTPNRIVVEASLERRGLLVSSEVWYPGWQVSSNGQETDLLRVEGTLRGVLLDPGTHTVEFRYQPWTAGLGLALSGGTVLALLVIAVYQLRRQP